MERIIVLYYNQDFNTIINDDIQKTILTEV